MPNFKHIKDIIETLEREIKRERNTTDALIKEYLFLFSKCTYTDGYKYKYSKTDTEFGGTYWFVNITYYSDKKSLHINTGTNDYKQINSQTSFDRPHDINKIRRAFEISCMNRIKNCNSILKHTKQENKLLRQLKGR